MSLVMQDLSKAFKFFSLASEQGWVDGQLQLGIMYYSMLMLSALIMVIIITHLLVLLRLLLLLLLIAMKTLC